MILLSMGLTTKYEQENEEQEVIQREAQENLDSLLEDQTVVFDTTEDATGTDDMGGLAPPGSHGATKGHFKSGSTVISEYLGVAKHSPS